jgi:hypothetical protein
MTKPKRASIARRLLIGALLFATVLALALVTTPWWWPHAIRGALADRGVTFGRFETLGYSRFVLHGVAFQNPSVTARVERVEADTPIVWLAHGLLSKPGPVAIGPWDVTLQPAEKNPPRVPPSTAGPSFARRSMTRFRR